jgi:protein subunit release factor A
MNKSIVTKLGTLSSRLEELDRLLSAEDATRDLDQYRRLTREHAEIAPVVKLYLAWQAAERDIDTAKEMALDPAATFSWRFAPGQEATNRRCSRATSFACTRASPSAAAGKWR